MATGGGALPLARSVRGGRVSPEEPPGVPGSLTVEADVDETPPVAAQEEAGPGTPASPPVEGAGAGAWERSVDDSVVGEVRTRDLPRIIAVANQKGGVG